MARERPKNPQADRGAYTGTSGATTGYEADLWRMADTLRGSMDAAEYKHVVPAQLDPDPRQKPRSGRKDVGDGNEGGESPC